MADDLLNRLGTAAIQKLPLPLQRTMRGTTFRFEGGPTESIASGSRIGNLAGVIPGQNVINIMDAAAFRRAPDQLAMHEGIHEAQDNFAPTIQAQIPPDDPKNPYQVWDTNRVAQLLAKGGTIANMPREQASATGQYYQSQGGDQSAPKEMRDTYGKLIQTIPMVPQSVIMPTDPMQKGINTTPRPPQVPYGVPGMRFAQNLYAKGQPPDSDPPPPAGYSVDSSSEPAPPAGYTVDIPENSVTQTGPKTFQGPNVQMPYSFKSLAQGVGDLGKGAAKGVANTLFNAGANTPMPSYLSGSGFTDHANVGPKPDFLNPQGTMQNLGYGAEQAGEFMLPASYEGKAAEAVPFLGKTLPKIGMQAVSSGLVNAAQGGDFKTGAIAGGVGGAVGRTAEAIAPAIAEKSVGIRGKFDRSFNKAPGRAILDETSGFRPGTVAQSAKDRIGQLDTRLQGMADQASVRARPRIAGLLPAPAEEMPLHSAPDIEGTPSRPVVLTQPDRPTLPLLPAPNRTIPSSYHADIFPDQLPQGTTNIPVNAPSEASGIGSAQYFGQIPGERGGQGQVQGVFMRRPAVPTSPRPIPTIEPNNIASLQPARGIISDAMGRAERQNASGTFGQLSNMNDFLSKRFSTGESIPDNVTPRELLDLRRGFNEEYGRWNPDLHDSTVTTGRNAYGALSNEFHNVLPQAAPVDSTISSLIPVKNRASITALNEGTAGRILNRVAVHTGAGAFAGLGSVIGYKEGGTEGAIKGGLFGLAAPEFLANPTTMMVGARGLNTLAQPIARYTGGIASQLFRMPQNKP